MCDIKIDENIYLKDRTVCKRRDNRNRRKDDDNTIFENQIDKQPKIDNVNKHKNPNVSTFENQAHIAIGPRNEMLGKHITL